MHVLLTGAVLAAGQRTVTAMLRLMGRSAAPDLPTSHRVLPRAVWSPRYASRLLRRLCVAGFVPRGVVLCGLDDTLERRRGARMTATGLDRDPGRSSPAPLVNASGLRGLGGLLLPPIAWAQRVWALPCLTVWCPSARCSAQHGRRPHPWRERAWQSIQRVRRWWPGRAVVVVASSRCAALEWLALVAQWPAVSGITRLRRDAALDDPPPPRRVGQRGRPRLTGKRRPTWGAIVAAEKTPWRPLTRDDGYGEGPREVEGATDTARWSHSGTPPVAIRWGLRRDPQEHCKPHALFSTHLEQTPTPMLPWVVQRWTREVTCAAGRAHLGMATPRQWHDRAMARATPALVSRYSIMTLTAHLRSEQGATWVRSTAW